MRERVSGTKVLIGIAPEPVEGSAVAALSAKPTSNLKKAMRGMGWLAGRSLALAVMRIGVVAIFARLLSPTDFAIAAAAGIFIELSRFLSISGVVQPLVQRRVLTEAQINTAFVANLLSSLLASALLICAASFIAAWFSMPYLVPVLCVVSLSFPLSGMSNVASKLLEREHNFAPLAKSDVISYILSVLIFGLPLAFMGWNFWALILPQVAQYGIRSAILMRAQPHSLKLRFDRTAYADLMRDGTGYSLQRFANFFALKGDYFVVGIILGPLSLGLYERAYVLMSLTNSLIMTGLVTVLFPAFARINHDLARVRAAYTRSVRMLALVFLPISALSILMGPEIIRILIGAKWGGTVLPFQILSGGMFLRAAYRLSSTVLNSLGKVCYSTMSQMIYATSVIGGALLFTRWGISGVALAILIGIAIHFTTLNAIAMHLIGMRPSAFIRAIAPGALIAGLVALIAAPIVLVLRAEAAPVLLRGGVPMAIAGLVAGLVILRWPAMIGCDVVALMRPRIARLQRTLAARSIFSR